MSFLDVALMLLAFFVFLGLPSVVILLVRDAIVKARWKHLYTPERLAELERARVHRVLQTDWMFYEDHLERPVPNALRELFADEIMVSGFLKYDWHELSLSPIDERGLLDTLRWIGHDVVALATSEAGDPIYLRPGTLESNAVFITYHDGMDTEELAPSVEVFVQRLRESNKAFTTH